MLSGAVVAIGDPHTGPLISMTIEKRLYPRKAPIHLHKSDTFRMAFEQPIIVGRTSYPHGHFRLQRADALYGPEIWTDEVGTNQFLVMADRRGAKPYLATAEHQHLVDDSLDAEMTWLGGVCQHPRDANVSHALRVSFDTAEHAGHIDGGFADTHSWSLAEDGTRLAAMAIGDVLNGPLLVALDRPPHARRIGGFQVPSDMIRLVVGGASSLGARVLGRLGFRIVPADQPHDASAVEPGGAQELWTIADRSAWATIAVDGLEPILEAVSTLVDNFAAAPS